jgi:hypothetical protein
MLLWLFTSHGLPSAKAHHRNSAKIYRPSGPWVFCLPTGLVLHEELLHHLRELLYRVFAWLAAGCV